MNDCYRNDDGECFERCIEYDENRNCIDWCDTTPDGHCLDDCYRNEEGVCIYKCELFNHYDECESICMTDPEGNCITDCGGNCPPDCEKDSDGICIVEETVDQDTITRYWSDHDSWPF